MFKYVVIFLIDVFLYISTPSSMNRGFMTTVLVMAALSIIMLVIDKRDILDNYLHKIYLRHSIFYVLCFSIVLFQCDLDYVLGIIDSGDYYLWYDTKIVAKALALSNLALGSLIFGYRLYKKDSVAFENDTFAIVVNRGGKKIVDFIVLFSLLVYLALIPSGQLVNSYDGTMEGAKVILPYLQAPIISMTILYCFSYNNANSKWFSQFRYPFFLCAIYIVLVMISGRRTEVLKIGSMLLLAYAICLKDKVNYKALSIYGGIMIVLISLIGVWRGLEGGDIQESYSLLSGQKSIIPFTREYAGSVNTLHIAMHYYPDTENFNWGSSFFVGFLKVIPGLTYVAQLIGIPVRSSDVIITDLFFHNNNYGGGWGLGSCCVADVYISFGTLGVVIIFMLFGYFLRWLEYITFVKISSQYSVALSFSCYSGFLFSCRGSFSILLLCWTYSCVILFLFNKKKNYKKRWININNEVL